LDHDHSHVKIDRNAIGISFLIGISLNLIFTCIEIYFGWNYESTALLSDAVHNLSDVSGLVIAFIAFYLQKIKPSKTLSYGYKKSTILASFLNSLFLAIAIGGITWEGIERLINQQPINGNVVSWVAGIGIMINFGSAYLFRSKISHDLNIKAAYWHLMVDALVSMGVVISGILIQITHWYFLDGITSLIIALVIIYSTWDLFKDSFIALLDGVPQGIKLDEVKNNLLKIQGVVDIHHIHVWSLSTDENAITCHVKIAQNENTKNIKSKIKHELIHLNITHSTIEFETNDEDCFDLNALNEEHSAIHNHSHD